MGKLGTNQKKSHPSTRDRAAKLDFGQGFVPAECSSHSGPLAPQHLAVERISGSAWAVLLYFFLLLPFGLAETKTTRHGTMLIALALEARTLRFFVCVRFFCTTKYPLTQLGMKCIPLPSGGSSSGTS